MTTYNNIIDYLKANRERVIENYNRIHKGVSLKDYMNTIINYFNEHKGIANKVLKGTCNDYLAKAIAEANLKANEKFRNQLNAQCRQEWCEQMNATGWYAKNYK